MKLLAQAKYTTFLAVSLIVSACSSNPKVVEPAPEPVVQAPAPAEIVQTVRGPSLTLDDVLFDFEQSTLRPEAADTIAKAVEYMKANPNRYALVEGHTDSSGDASFNQMLSVKRSEAIRDALVAGGVSSYRIKTLGMGETQPVANNKTLSGRQANRRAEILFKLADIES